MKTARSAVGVECTTFPTAATDDDKDWRLYTDTANEAYDIMVMIVMQIGRCRLLTVVM